MRVQLNCAVRNVTGSRHVLEANGRAILLDCGMYQGRRQESYQRNKSFNFDPSYLHACILSHAHIDHSGALPTLGKSGFKGKVYATPATISLAAIMLHDSAHIQERDADYLNRKRRRKNDAAIQPLYGADDVDWILKRFVPVDYNKEFEPAPGVRATFLDAGHILGSAVLLLEITENGKTCRFGFTGDLGRKSMPILRDPVQLDNLDALVTESTYGNREHPEENTMRQELGAIINKIHGRKGKLVIPAFSVGRTQTLLYYIQQLREKKEVPQLKIFVDSPLSIEATRIVARHPECFDMSAQRMDAASAEQLFHFPGVEFTQDVEASRAINNYDGPCIVITASGMCESGRVLHHLKQTVGTSRNGVLIVGWQAPHTLGRRLVDGEEFVRIFDRRYHVNAEILRMNGLSAHADGSELTEYADKAVRPDGKIIMVHGELDASEALSTRLHQRGRSADNLFIPRDHDWIEI